MSAMRERIRNLTIRQKIIFYMYSVIIPILIVICTAVTIYRYYDTREAYERQLRAGVENLAASLKIVEEDVRNLSLSLALNQDIQELFSLTEPGKLNEDVKLWQNRTPVQFVEDMMALKGYIKTVSVYPENGIFPYLRCIDSSAYLPDLETVRTTEAYQEAAALKGKGIWVSTSKGAGEVYQASRSEKLVHCREVFSWTKNRALGYITIGISQDVIRELCGNILQEEGEGLLLLDSQGRELLSLNQVPEGLSAYLQRERITPKNGYCGVYEKWDVYAQETSAGGWYVYRSVPKRGFFSFFSEIAYLPIFLLLGVSLGMLPFLKLISNIISKPLENVCVAMGKFRQGDFEQQVEIRTNDEVGEVAACFNQMVTDIRQLINKNYIMVLKERESELAVLQAQINPHFLYNALDSIYWQATGEGDEATAESIYELAQLFRLVLGQGKELVTVEMELELLQRYLEIQKLRFHEQMEYQLQAEPDILGEKIPKLILQPFVENAVVHGMQNDNEDFRITVTAKKCGDDLEFLIRDTGVGMDAGQLRRIWEEDEEKVFTGQKIGRYAIKNVKERLELKYGDRFTLKIDSHIGQGTLVSIRVPAEEGREHGIEIVDC